jgi:DNA-binding CsgD family transcriptional regulator
MRPIHRSVSRCGAGRVTDDGARSVATSSRRYRAYGSQEHGDSAGGAELVGRRCIAGIHIRLAGHRLRGARSVGGMSVIGRVEERGALNRLLDEARRGLSGALVLCGEAGIGKTKLLDYAATAAVDFRVLRVAGFESERDLAFAAVHRLLLPFLARREILPPLQRSTLESAFGLAEGTPADRFLVGLATLSLLADAAAARPLLCVVDDSQWLDDESLAALAFAGRRLHADHIAMVFGVRDSNREPLPLDGLPTVRLEGLAEPDAVELLRSVVTGPLDKAAAERVVADTLGSPLAIVELAGGLTAEQLTAQTLLPEPLPIGRRLEEHFLRNVRALPPDTQTLLVLASAEASGDPSLIAAAGKLLELPVDAADAAEAARLLTMSPLIRFHHPLVRSAVYGGAGPAERRRIHSALAAVAGDAGDSDRRAWHLGAAATGPDEQVAAELAAAAERALRRGGCAASAAFYTRAAELSPDRSFRVERTLAAAQRHLTAGFRIRARDVLSELAREIDDPLQRAVAARLDGLIRYTVGDAPQTASILIGAARALETFDIHAARDTLLEALAAARVTGQFTAPGESEIDVGLAARAMPLPPGSEPTIGDLFLDGDSTLFIDGHAAAAPVLRRAIDALEADPSDSAQMLWWLAIGCWAAGALGDDEALHRLARRLEQTARDRGALVPLSIGLIHLGMAELFDGSLSAARVYLSERSELMEAIGRPSDIGRLVTSAWSGDEPETRAEAAALTAYATKMSHGWLLGFVDYAVALLELGLGNYAAAFAAATKDYQHNPFLSVASFPDLIEAAVRTGERAAAEHAFEEFSSRALVNATPRALGLLARCRALLAADAQADAFYEESIDRLGHPRRSAQRARSQLLYGEWLRRQNRRLDAREQLRTAHGVFTAMGANAFADRAWRELSATGERARRRTVDTTADLTPQEARIAELAAVGATNPEIANKLFLSASTVDYHLRKVYRKLDVTSRRQLAQALRLQSA